MKNGSKMTVYSVEEVEGVLDALEDTPVYWEGDEDRGWNLWISEERSDRDPDVQIRPVWGEDGLEGYSVINALTAPHRTDHIDCLKLLY